MRRFSLTLAFLIFSILLLNTLSEETEKGVVTAKHSFQQPFLFGINSAIPYWEYGGSSVATENFVRLTPAVKSRVGWIWNLEPVEFKDWQVELSIKIHNTHSVGADGLGFWYSKDIKKDGSLFGQDENFEGFGIIFDSYDNNGDGSEPAILGVRGTGNGQGQWDYDDDLKKKALDRCHVDFRRTTQDSSFFKVKITYEKHILSVHYDPMDHGEYVFCFSIPNIIVPPGYHFGLTALTGGVTDYHDVASLVTRNLDPSAESPEDIQRGYWDPHQYFEEEERKKREEEEHKKHQEEHERALKENQARDKEIETQAKHEHQVFEDIREKLRKFKENNPSEEASKKTGVLVLQALEEVSKTMQTTSKKHDISNLVAKVTVLVEEQETIKNSLLQVQTSLHDKLEDSSKLLQRETEMLNQQIKQLETVLHGLSGYVSSLSDQQSQLGQHFTQTSDHIKQNVNTSSGSSFGFWVYFILFQIVFAAAFIYYKSYREMKNTKIF